MNSSATYFPPPLLYSTGTSTNIVTSNSTLNYTIDPVPAKKAKPTDPVKWLRARVNEIVEYGELPL